MKKSRRTFSRDFKLKAVTYANSDTSLSIASIAKALEVNRQALWSWIKEVHEKGEDHAFPGSGRREPRLITWMAPTTDEEGLTHVDAIRAENDLLRKKLDRTIAERDALQGVIGDLLSRATGDLLREGSQ